MLINEYIMEPNPTKHAKHNKYYLEQLEKNSSKMTKIRGTSLGSSDKLDYNLLALLGGVFCIYFYFLSFIAQQCFTFFLTTFLLNNATALQCQHYAYHLIHFLLAHFFTFVSKLLLNKITQLADRCLTKVCSVAKRKYLESSFYFGNLYNLLRKCKIWQLFLWKEEKTEDKKALISNYEKKRCRKRKTEKMLEKDFYVFPLGVNRKIKSSRNLYQKLTRDPVTINSNNLFNNLKTVNNWTLGNFQILTLSEVNYIEVSRTPIDGTHHLIDSPGPSKDQGLADYTTYNSGANDKQRNDSKHPFKRIFNNGLSRTIHLQNMKAETVKNTITENLKNKCVLLNKTKNCGVRFRNKIITKCNCIRIAQLRMSKTKWNFKWKKRHKEFKDKPLKVVCKCYKYDSLFEDVDEIDKESEWFKTQYEKSVGKATEPSIPRKDVLRSLKRQASCCSLWSPAAFGYRDQVKLPLEALQLEWGKTPTAKLCTCPSTACTCEGSSLAPPANIPRGYIKNLSGVAVIRLLHAACGCCCNCVLRWCAPAPARTLFPRLRRAVRVKQLRYAERGSANMPAEFCASACKQFFIKTDRFDFDDVAGTNKHDRPVSEDGLVEQEIEGAGETVVYGIDDNIYARGFTLATATQTEYDEKGRLLREDTDRIKISFTLRYTMNRDLERKHRIEQFESSVSPLPISECTLGTLLHVPEIKEQICKMKEGIEETFKILSGTFSIYKRSWRLGVEEMSEQLSSYAKDLQSRVGLGESQSDLSDDESAYKRSDEGPTKPNYDHCDCFETPKSYALPTKGHSWPDIRPRMRYDESNQTDNYYSNSFEKEKDNKKCNVKSSKKNNNCPCCAKSYSFTKIECKANNTVNPHGKEDPTYFTAKQTDVQLRKKMVRCMCYHPKPSQKEENDKTKIKPSVKCLCHHPKPSKKEGNGKLSSESTKRVNNKTEDVSSANNADTNNIVTDGARTTNELTLIKAKDSVNATHKTAAGIANKNQDNLKGTPETATNNGDTAETMPTKNSKFNTISCIIKKKKEEEYGAKNSDKTEDTTTYYKGATSTKSKSNNFDGKIYDTIISTPDVTEYNGCKCFTTTTASMVDTDTNIQDKEHNSIEDYVKDTLDKRATPTKSTFNNIDGKIENTVISTADVAGNNGCECDSMTTTGLVDNATNVTHKEQYSIEDDVKNTHDKGVASTKSKSYITDGKIQDNVSTTPDLSGNKGCDCVTITTAGVVDNATNITLKEDNSIEDDVKDTHCKANNILKIANVKENLSLCLMPEIRTGGDIKYITDKNKKYAKQMSSNATKVRFERTDDKNDIKSEYEKIASSLKAEADRERFKVYYRCRRKSKAEVNSATTMDDIEEILSTKQQKFK